MRAAGAVLLGPNCLGVFDAGEELELAAGELPAGSIGLVSQSGNIALELGLLAEEAGLGFSRFVSLGNQADLEAVDLVRDLAAHAPTELIAVYVEDFRDGRAFAEAAHVAHRAGKRVLLLAIERTEATARAVRSHTGALASDGAAIDAACRAAGIERVRTPQELIDLAEGCCARRCPPAGASRSSPTAAATAGSRPASPTRRASSCPSWARTRSPSCAAACPRARPRPTRSTWPAAASRTSARSTTRPARCSPAARSTRSCCPATSAATASTATR